jgi:hypothetical protein
VATNGEFGPSTIAGGLSVSPDGKTAYFATFRDVNDKPVWSSWQLRASDLATGHTRLIHNIRGTEGSPAAVTFDPTGSYLLIEHVTRAGPGTSLVRLDLTTGQGASLNVSWAVGPSIAG